MKNRRWRPPILPTLFCLTWGAFAAAGCSGNLSDGGLTPTGSSADDNGPTGPDDPAQPGGAGTLGSSTLSSSAGAKLSDALAIGGPALLSVPSAESPVPAAGQSCATTLVKTGEVPKLVPEAYVRAGAGCHATNASGGDAYPGLHTPKTYEAFAAQVRAGISKRRPEMPSFAAKQLDDDDLRRIYAWATGSPLEETGSCTAKAVPSAADLDADYVRGLAAFRKQDATLDGKSCAQCHATDGMLFAYLGFTDGDILRCGQTHLKSADAMAVVDMVTALRQKYKMPRRDPMLSGPFQPGKLVVAGGNVAARDRAFGQQLADMNLQLAKGFINITTAANKVETELLALDLHDLRVPIVFNKYAEDGFHNPKGYVPDCSADTDSCSDHATFAEWIPVAAHVPANYPGYVQSVDKYLAVAKPTMQDLGTLLAALPGPATLEGVYPGDESRYFDHTKWRSSFLLDHCVRLEVMGANPNCYSLLATQKARPVLPTTSGDFPSMADVWDTGSFAKRIAEGNAGTAAMGEGCNLGHKGCNPPQSEVLYNNVLPGSKLLDHWQRVGNSWFTAHWVHFDPSLMSTGDNTAQPSEYFTRALFWADNDSGFGTEPGGAANPAYSSFAAFHVAVHNVVLLNKPQAYDCTKKMPFSRPDLGSFPCTAVDIRSGYYPEMPSFAEEKNFNNDSNWSTYFAPKEEPRKTQYLTLTGNMHRLFLRKLIGALQQNNWMCRPDIEKLRMRRAKAFLAPPEIVAANGTADQEMFSTLEALMAGSTSSCPR